MRRSAAVLVAVFYGCSGGGDDNAQARDAGGVSGAACGTKGTMEGTECADATGCGGTANTTVRFNCSNCPIEATTRTCVSGRCDTYDRSGNVNFGFNVSGPGVGAASFVGIVIDPLMANGDRVTCDALMSTCTLIDNAQLNVVNTEVGNAVLSAGMNYFRPASAHVGSDRIGYLIVTSEMGGNGTVVAHGCKEGLTVMSGQTTNVEITLRSL